MKPGSGGMRGPWRIAPERCWVNHSPPSLHCDKGAIWKADLCEGRGRFIHISYWYRIWPINTFLCAVKNKPCVDQSWPCKGIGFNNIRVPMAWLEDGQGITQGRKSIRLGSRRVPERLDTGGDVECQNAASYCPGKNSPVGLSARSQGFAAWPWKQEQTSRGWETLMWLFSALAAPPLAHPCCTEGTILPL